MLKGWFRRRYLWYLKRKTVRYWQQRRQGACKQCGRCCGWCPALERKNKRCRIYEHRPAICREYMLTPEDKKENPYCGFYFEEE